MGEGASSGMQRTPDSTLFHPGYTGSADSLCRHSIERGGFAINLPALVRPVIGKKLLCG